MTVANGLTMGELRDTWSEAQFQNAVLNVARAGGWGPIYHTKISMMSAAGFPDLVMVRGTRVVFAELKSAKGKVSAAQMEWHEALAATAAEAFIWRAADWDEIEEVLA